MQNELADLTAKAEQFVGVEGGGMDQAIEILADKGNALLIEFNPLRSEKIYLPENAHFAVLHSGRMLSKAASSQYNERVVECRISAQVFLINFSNEIFVRIFLTFSLNCFQ